MAAGQQYDLVLRGGHVIDPGNRIDGRMDVAVSNGRIAAVQADIPAAQARKVVDVTGFYVVPGLIDLHAHVFGYEGSLVPDETALPAGTTTIVDAGGSGWRTFDEFRRTVIAPPRRGFSRCSTSSARAWSGSRTRATSKTWTRPRRRRRFLKNRDVIVGIKTAHFGKPGWTAIDRAVDAGRRAERAGDGGRQDLHQLGPHHAGRAAGPFAAGRHSHAHVQRPADGADRSIHRQGRSHG